MAESNIELNVTVMEFAVRMQSSADMQLVRDKLQGVEGVINIDINLSDETISEYLILIFVFIVLILWKYDCCC